MYSENENYKKLFIALKNNQYNEAEAILSQGADINYKNSRGENLLWKAIDLNNIEMFEWLINKGCAIESLNTSNESLINHAINQNNVNFLLFILNKNRSNINKISLKGFSPLMLACSENKKEAIKILVEFGCDINIQNQYLNTALIIAIAKSDYDVVSFLIENGADLSLANNDGDTALIISAKYRKLESLICLLRNGSEELINKRNKYGSTVTSFIINSQFVEETPEIIIDILIEKNADFNVNIFGERASSPFLESIKSGDINTFLKLIRTKNINVNIIDSEGNDIIHYLCLYNYLTPELLQRIIECNYDIKNVKSKEGFTPYYALVKNESSYEDIEKMVKILKEHGFINTYKTLSNENLLDICLANRNKNLLEILFKNKVLDIKEAYINRNKLIHKITEIIKDSEELGVFYMEREISSIKEEMANNDDGSSFEDALEYIQQEERQIQNLKRNVKDILSYVIKESENNGFSINEKNDDGDTPLMLLISSGQALMLEYFMAYNPNILIENEYGENALCYAIKYGRLDVFEKLFSLINNSQNEASKLLVNIIYNLPDDERRKAITLITIEDIIETLIPYINNSDEDGNTPLIIACALNEEQMVKILLKYGANALLKNKSNETALMHACSNNNINIVKALIEKDVDVNARNNKSYSAIDLTTNKEIEEMLINRN